MLYLSRWCNHIENMTLARSTYNEYFIQWTLLSVHNLDSLKEVLHLLWYLHLQENPECFIHSTQWAPAWDHWGFIKEDEKTPVQRTKEKGRNPIQKLSGQTNVQHDKLKATSLFCFITLISTGGSPEENLESQLIPAKQKHSQVTLKTHQGHQAQKSEGFWLFSTMENTKNKTKPKQKTKPKKPHHRKQQQKPTPNYI